MRKTCNLNCKFFEDIDLFGKETELYYNGNSKLTSWVGKTLTILYVLGYLGFFIYKVVRMVQRVDVTFYDSYAFTGAPPYINLTKEKFYGGFALGDLRTMQTFVDNRIYFVKAFYVSGVRKNGIWDWKKEELNLEVCNLEKFGANYREIFSTKSMDKMHCVTSLHHRLEGHLTYDVYSYYLVKFFPCVNLPFCAPIDDVKALLTQTFVTFKMEDVDLTPQIYDSPVALRGKEVSATVGSSLFQDVHSFFQVINIETDEDILGFDGLNQIKKEKYIKYDQSAILSQLKPDIFTSGDSIVDVTIALSEQELTQKRTYPKLLEVLGDVGGLMEVVFSLFRILSMFLTEAIYETSLINHLFSFDLDKRTVLIKEKKRKKKEIELNDSPQIYSPNNKILPTQNSPNNKILPRQNSPIINSNEEMTFVTKNKLEDDIIKNRQTNENILLVKATKKKRKKKIKAKTLFSNSESISKNKTLNAASTKKENENDIKVNFVANFDENNKKEVEKEIKDFSKELEREKKSQNNSKRSVIKKINHNKFCLYFCFCCVRKRKNIENLLIDEGMKIVTEKLDLMNLFKILYKEEKNQTNSDTKFEVIEMSEECIIGLQKLNKA